MPPLIKDQETKAKSKHVWKPDVITVILENGTECRPEVEVCGPLAVGLYCGKEPKSRVGKWCPMHIASGLTACWVSEREDAVKIAEHLLDTCLLAFRQSGPKQVVAMMPRWVRPWLTACRDADGWTDPKLYRGVRK